MTTVTRIKQRGVTALLLSALLGLSPVAAADKAKKIKPAPVSAVCTGLSATPSDPVKGVPVNFVTPHTLSGDGSANAPYQIYVADQLLSLSRTPSDYDKHFIQCADIEMDTLYEHGYPMFKMGLNTDVDPAIGFTGSYDGRGHLISGFVYVSGHPQVDLAPADVTVIHPYSVFNKVSYSDSDVGLFTRLESGAVVKNLKLSEAFISVKDASAGILAGTSSARLIENVSVSGSIRGISMPAAGLWNEVSVGGVVGEVFPIESADDWYEDNQLRDISAFVDIKVEGEDLRLVGGVAGTLESVQASSLRASGRIEVNHDDSHPWSMVGGLAGRIWNGHVNNALAEVEVKSLGEVGGFAGMVYLSQISRAAAHGDVSIPSPDVLPPWELEADFFGGFAGSIGISDVSWSYARGDVNGAAMRSGGFVGNLYNSRVTNAFATGDVDGGLTAGGFTGRVVGNLAQTEGQTQITNAYASGNVKGCEFAGGFHADTFASFDYIVADYAFAAGKAEVVDCYQWAPPSADAHGFGPQVTPANNIWYSYENMGPGAGDGYAGLFQYFTQPNWFLGMQWPTGEDGWMFTKGELPRFASEITGQ